MGLSISQSHKTLSAQDSVDVTEESRLVLFVLVFCAVGNCCSDVDESCHGDVCLGHARLSLPWWGHSHKVARWSAHLAS